MRETWVRAPRDRVSPAMVLLGMVVVELVLILLGLLLIMTGHVHSQPAPMVTGYQLVTK